jgi:hypothetical protein
MSELYDFQPGWERLVDRCLAQGYAALSPPERVWFNVQSLTRSIANGGLVSYYYNSPADTLADCLDALDLLGAAEMTGLMERMNGFFPDGVPADLTARNAVINAWPEDDDAFDRTMDEIEARALAEFPRVEAMLVRYLEDTGLAR